MPGNYQKFTGPVGPCNQKTISAVLAQVDIIFDEFPVGQQVRREILVVDFAQAYRFHNFAFHPLSFAYAKNQIVYSSGFKNKPCLFSHLGFLHAQFCDYRVPLTVHKKK